MTSEFLYTLLQYGAPVIIGFLTGLIFKAAFTRTMQDKIRSYQKDLVASESERLKLEHENKMLQNKVVYMERNFSGDRVLLN